MYDFALDYIPLGFFKVFLFKARRLLFHDAGSIDPLCDQAGNNKERSIGQKDAEKSKMYDFALRQGIPILGTPGAWFYTMQPSPKIGITQYQRKSIIFNGWSRRGL